jgi:hypothetical protein
MLRKYGDTKIPVFLMVSLDCSARTENEIKKSKHFVGRGTGRLPVKTPGSPGRGDGRRARARPSGHGYRLEAHRKASLPIDSSRTAATLQVGSTPVLTAPLRIRQRLRAWPTRLPTTYARSSPLFSAPAVCAPGSHAIFCCLHVPARAALLTDVALVDAMGGLMICVPVCMHLFASGPALCSAICVVMRLEKRVRTKKWVALCVISLATQREQ